LAGYNQSVATLMIFETNKVFEHRARSPAEMV